MVRRPRPPALNRVNFDFNSRQFEERRMISSKITSFIERGTDLMRNSLFLSLALALIFGFPIGTAKAQYFQYGHVGAGGGYRHFGRPAGNYYGYNYQRYNHPPSGMTRYGQPFTGNSNRGGGVRQGYGHGGGWHGGGGGGHGVEQVSSQQSRNLNLPMGRQNFGAQPNSNWSQYPSGPRYSNAPQYSNEPRYYREQQTPSRETKQHTQSGGTRSKEKLACVASKNIYCGARFGAKGDKCDCKNGKGKTIHGSLQ